MKFRRAILTFVVLTFLTNLTFFSAAYFYNRFVPSQYLMLIPYAIISITSGIIAKVHIVKKLLFIVVFFITGTISGFILVFSTMFLPGSKEHNYVMNHICLPALKQHYKNRGEFFSLMNDQGWKEHSTCEQNVWDGKAPLAGIK